MKREAPLDDPTVEGIWFSPTTDHEASRLRNLFDERSAESAARLVGNADPSIAAIALQHLAARESLRGKICPNCLQRIAQTGGRGRPRIFCSRGCQTAAAMRAMRDRADPNRAARLRHFGEPTNVIAGFVGRRQHRPKRYPWRGIDSVATEALRVQLHVDAVAGNASAAERVAEFLDGGWTPAHRKALARAGSLREQFEENAGRCEF